MVFCAKKPTTILRWVSRNESHLRVNSLKTVTVVQPKILPTCWAFGGRPVCNRILMAAGLHHGQQLDQVPMLWLIGAWDCTTRQMQPSGKDDVGLVERLRNASSC